MDIVVRTPHGDADIAIRAHDPTATIHELVRLVTGQAVPSVAALDGRTIDTETTLTDAGTAMGSVIDTTDPAPPSTGAAITLLQLAGPGSGIERPLPAGRYRLGPGRRIHASELEMAAVGITAVELTVGDDGSVEARPGYEGSVAIGGQDISEPTPWSGGMLSVAGRVFAVESPPKPIPPRRLAHPDSRGMVVFNRPPRAGDEGPRHLVVDAVRDAVGARPTLWRQRAGDLAAFTVAIGLAGGPPGPITIDLAAERGVALIGRDEFTTALARTMLVEATTLHGPADLDIAIATRRDRLAHWDWAKWLPHLRHSGSPRFISSEPQLHEWVAVLETRAARTAGKLSPAHLTLLVADDPDLWMQRDSPFIGLLSSQPIGLRLLTLAPRAGEAPAVCTAIVTETDRGTAHLVVPDRDVDVDGIVPALTETGTATTVARHLAPLDDTEGPVVPTFTKFERGPESLRDLLGPLPHDVESVVDAWRRSTPPLPDWLRVPVGVTAGERLTANIGSGRNILVTGTRAELAADVATGIVCAIAAQLPADALSIVHVATGPTAALDLLDDLPHLAGRFGHPGAMAATRLIVRLAHVVGGLDADRRRVLVVLDDARRTAEASPGLGDGLIELADAFPALQLLMTTDSARSEFDRRQRASFAVQIAVDDTAGHRRGSLRIDSERLHEPFAPYARPETAAGPGGLVVRPVAFGRALTALERRLDLLGRRARSDAGEGEVGKFVGMLSEAARQLDLAPPDALVPIPLPQLHRSETLLRDWAGDAIPLGLVDLPERLEATPLWWQPGPLGSLLFLGSPRSGIDAALSTIVLGAPARFSPDEVHIYSIDPLNRRRVAAGLLPHTVVATPPEQVDEVVGVLEELAAESERRLEAEVGDAPALLLLVHDLGQLRRQLEPRHDVGPLLDVIAGAAGVNVNIVATAWRSDEAGSLVDQVHDVLVGAMAERDDYNALGVLDPQAIEGQPGRCWSTATDRMIQLATPPRSLTTDRGRTVTGTLRPPTGPKDTPGPVMSP